MIRQSTISFLCQYSEKGKTAALSAAADKQLAVFNARAWNRTGSTINVGICRRFADGKRNLYTKVVSDYTLVSAAALAAGQVVANTTNNDGFVVQADRKFGLVGVTVSNAATGGTYAAKYWNGSSFVALTSLEIFTDFGSTGDKYLVFLPPVDWAVGGPTGVNQQQYSILIQHTTAPGDTGAINDLWVAELLDYYEGLGDNVAMQVIADSDRPFLLEQGESLMPYFSTAGAANAFGAFYSTV